MMGHIPTITLLPGLLCDASIWAAQKTALERLAPVVVADFSQLSCITEMASAVLGGTEGFLVAIGHSMGARVALEMARLAPQRIVGLALIDTGIHPRKDGEQAKRQMLVDLAYEQGMAALADEWLPPMVDPRRNKDNVLLAPLKAMVARATADQHARQIKALLNRPDARDGLARIGCPTLVMVGRQDQWSPLAQHEEIASLIPTAELAVIEDCGHMSLVERPEETTRRLIAWITSEVLPRFRAGGNNTMREARAPDQIPDTPLFDRQRSLRGYRLNKMAMGLGDPANRRGVQGRRKGVSGPFRSVGRGGAGCSHP